MDTRTSPFRRRIERVRDALKRHGLAAVVVPSSDPHLSEYLPERWQGRQWLSGFTGSMGTLVVTQTGAAVFADSRYWTQAEHELAGSGIQLVKIPTGTSTHHVDWLVEQLKAGDTVGVDGDVLGLAAAQYLAASLGQAAPGASRSVRTRTPARSSAARSASAAASESTVPSTATVAPPGNSRTSQSRCCVFAPVGTCTSSMPLPASSPAA